MNRLLISIIKMQLLYIYDFFKRLAFVLYFFPIIQI